MGTTEAYSNGGLPGMHNDERKSANTQNLFEAATFRRKALLCERQGEIAAITTKSPTLES